MGDSDSDVRSARQHYRLWDASMNLSDQCLASGLSKHLNKDGVHPSEKGTIDSM